MARLLGIWRTVLRRDRAEWPLVLAAWLLLVCATTLLVATAVYAEAAATGGLRTSVAAARPADTAVRVHAAAPAGQAETLNDGVSGALTATLGGAGRASLLVRSDALSPAGVDSSDASRQISVASIAEVASHATLVAGAWARAGATPVEASISEGAARNLGLAPGDEVTLTEKLDPARHVTIRVVGVWRPDAGDRFWLGDPLDLSGIATVGGSTTRGPFVVERADLARLVGTTPVDLEWRWLPAIERLDPATVDALRGSVVGLGGSLQATMPRPYPTVETTLPDILAAATRAQLVARGGILLLAAQLAVLSGYAVLLVAGLLVDRRRPETALLRSRGATGLHVAALSVAEALLLAVPAALVAPVLAIALVGLLGAVIPLVGNGAVGPVGVGSTAIAVAAATALASAVVLVLPSLPSPGTLAGVRAAIGRQVGRTLAQRLGIDLALVVAAALALWQLQLYGAPLIRDVRGNLGLDPLLVSAPAIGLLAGAVMATRGIPRVAELGERLVGGRRGIVAPLLAWQVGRRPLRYTRAALLLMLAAALGTFAATYSATWSRSQDDQAAYQAALDLRAAVSDYPTLDAWAVGPSMRGIPGVTAAAPVLRQNVDVGRTIARAPLLAIDPATVQAATSRSAAGAHGGAVPPAAADAVALALPGTPARLAVTFDAQLAVPGAFAGDPFDSSQVAVAVSAVVLDTDGLHRFSGGSGKISGANQRVEIPLSATIGGVTYRPAFPLRLVGIELAVTGGFFELDGAVELRAVELSSAAAGGAWQPAGLRIGAAGWAWSRVDQDEAAPYTAPATAPGRVLVGHDSGMAAPISQSGSSPTPTVLRYAATSDATASLPVVVNPRFLELAGAAPGDVTAASMAGFPLTLRIAGVRDAFPPLDPTSPFILADRDTLALAAYAAWGRVPAPAEWWVAAKPGFEPAIAARLTAAPYGAPEVVDRTALARSLSADPIALGVIGGLGLGAIAAIAVAAIGFLLGAVSAARDRLSEFALLRAVGLPARSVGALLALEQAFLLALGLLGGAALGLLLGVFAIPFASLTAGGAPTVPSPVIVVPWLALAPIAAVAVALLAGAAFATTRVAASVRLAELLRGRDE